LEYNYIISHILKTTFRPEYGNMNESVGKSIFEIAINEMKISLDSIKTNPWAFHILCDNIYKKIIEKYKIGCNISGKTRRIWRKNN
jgi:hypothetical protein